jgi:hypothetical protein
LREDLQLIATEETTMKWAMPFAAALSILFVNLHAQQPTKSAHSTRLVTGCLRAGDASETYRLTNASPRIDVAEPAGQPVGTSGDKLEYEVAADTGLDRSGPPIDLKPHVGQQVQLTVRPVEPAPAPSAKPAAQTAEVRPSEHKPPRVIVTAVKSLASSCS